jgi:hypothetical protein
LCPCLQLHSTTDMWNPHVMVIFNLENLYAQACGSGRRHLLGPAHIRDWPTRASGWSLPFPCGLADAHCGRDVVPPGRRMPWAGATATKQAAWQPVAVAASSRGWRVPHPTVGRPPLLLSGALPHWGSSILLDSSLRRGSLTSGSSRARGAQPRRPSAPPRH